MNGPDAGDSSPILVVPCVEAGKGGGHLARCAALVRDLRALGQGAVLFLGPPPVSIAASTRETSARALETLAPLLAELDPSWVSRDPRAGPWRFIVLDRFQTPAPEYRFWASLAFLIGIDEGGPCRAYFDVLIDLLPGLPGRGLPNFLDPSLLPLPDTVRSRPLPEGGPLKVLISFGAEDAAGLGRDCAAALRFRGGAGPDPGFQITLVDPTAMVSDTTVADTTTVSDTTIASDTTVVRSIPRLAEHLAGYDLLITHFGLSAFEALHAGIPVLLVSPGPRHERLAGAAGFPSAGIGKRGARRVTGFLRGAAWTRLLHGRDSLARRHGVAGHSVAGHSGPKLADILAAFEPAGHRCPGCGTGREEDPFHPVLARFPDRSFRRCTSCGLVYMSRINEAPIEYGREYFFEFYRNQYGKTYLEDFPHLVAMGEQRLTHILSLLPAPRGVPDSGAGEGRKLLDIGCAYGPFLKAAAWKGFDVQGLDPAEDAVRYVRDTLGLRAFRGFFPDSGGEQFPASSFSVITLWYVIEHITALAQALTEAARLLEEGGVLAFSTPSFSGISGRSSRRNFLEQSPADHWTIWSPRVSLGLLRRYGFTLKKVVSTGHHPERFPLFGRYRKGKKGPVYRFLLLLSRVFGLGDTFEVYAVKETR